MDLGLYMYLLVQGAADAQQGASAVSVPGLEDREELS